MSKLHYVGLLESTVWSYIRVTDPDCHGRELLRKIWVQSASASTRHGDEDELSSGSSTMATNRGSGYAPTRGRSSMIIMMINM